jgi:DNA-binding NarL/FixJ family response regulator
MSTMLRQILARGLAREPGVDVRLVDGDGDAVHRAIRRLEPDWLILELAHGNSVETVLGLFDARPRVKILALADRGGRSLACVQLGELSTSRLLRALERIDRSEVFDVAR